ncbi:J domain-containing protein [Marinobacter salicampi]|uniref:J domain-containing protein n=1 Tax=Marinobacter salicampi TaxID=435907 RepID=UPI00140B9E4D|nr:J domain-containing protein [Marinobacter salicampi]
MNCWEILGIEPTRDKDAIEQAFARQQKFASDEQHQELQQAYQEALMDAGLATSPAQQPVESSSSRHDVATPRPDSSGNGSDRELDANERQLVHDTVVQVRALLNDPPRSRDINVWRAIITEPPADQEHIRSALSEALSREVRPMAQNGSFPADVTLFLGDWFGWADASRQARSLAEKDPSDSADDRGETLAEQKPQIVNFWPAIIGWIVGIVILTAMFGGMGGGG